MAWAALAGLLAISLFLPWGFDVEGVYFNRGVGAASSVFVGAGDADAWDGSWWLAAVLAFAALTGALAALRPALHRAAAPVVGAAAVTTVVYFIVDGGGVRWEALLAVAAAGALGAALAIAEPR